MVEPRGHELKHEPAPTRVIRKISICRINHDSTCEALDEGPTHLPNLHTSIPANRCAVGVLRVSLLPTRSTGVLPIQIIARPRGHVNARARVTTHPRSGSKMASHRLNSRHFTTTLARSSRSLSNHLNNRHLAPHSLLPVARLALSGNRAKLVSGDVHSRAPLGR